MQCALCGYEFTREDVGCSASCPLVGGCNVTCCPRCGYGVPDETQSAIVRLARKAGDAVRRRTRRPEGAS